MWWPFKRKTPICSSFPIDKYRLDAPIEETQGLVEFSNNEYEIYGRQFEGEKNYNAPPVIFLGYQWKLMLGTVSGKIYKIAIYLTLGSEQEADPIAMETLLYCIEKLGSPSSQITGLFTWDTTDGNTILQTGEVMEGFSIALFLTSRSVRKLK